MEKSTPSAQRCKINQPQHYCEMYDYKTKTIPKNIIFSKSKYDLKTRY